jgi:hypothetical protein
MKMTKNTKMAIIAVGVAAVAYFMWKRKKDSSEKVPTLGTGGAGQLASNPTMTTRPMIIGEVS